MNALHLFTFAGIPVAVSGWYVLLIGYFAYGAGLVRGLVFATCVTVSILVHEFGHALVAKRLRLSPRIMLHGWGGLCAHDRADSDRHDVFIIAAGPGAGLILGGLVYAAKLAVEAAYPMLLLENEILFLGFYYMIYINVFWSLVNLVPLWPLDGGQLFRIGMLRTQKSAARAETITHYVGLLIGMAGLGLAVGVYNSVFLAILAGFLAYENATRIGASTSSGPIRQQSDLAKSLMADAETAFFDGDYREAARLCFQARADTPISGPALDKLWAILAVSLEAQGKDKDAADYAKRTSDKLLAQVRANMPPAA